MKRGAGKWKENNTSREVKKSFSLVFLTFAGDSLTHFVQANGSIKYLRDVCDMRLVVARFSAHIVLRVTNLAIKRKSACCDFVMFMTLLHAQRGIGVIRTYS